MLCAATLSTITIVARWQLSPRPTILQGGPVLRLSSPSSLPVLPSPSQPSGRRDVPFEMKAQLSSRNVEGMRSDLLWRLAKVSAVCSAVGGWLSVSSPSFALRWKSLCGSVVCMLPSLFASAIATGYGTIAIAYGYGIAFMVHAVFFGVLSASPSSRLLSLVSGLYGFKVCILQAALRHQPSSMAQLLSPSLFERGVRMGTSNRLRPLHLGRNLSLVLLFSLPLLPVPSSLSVGVAVGALISLLGLVLQSVADAQKLRFRETYGSLALCRTGLWKFCRHPDLLGEVYIQIGFLVARVFLSISQHSVSATLLCPLAPATMIWFVVKLTRKLE